MRRLLTSPPTEMPPKPTRDSPSHGRPGACADPRLAPDDKPEPSSAPYPPTPNGICEEDAVEALRRDLRQPRRQFES